MVQRRFGEVFLYQWFFNIKSLEINLTIDIFPI